MLRCIQSFPLASTLRVACLDDEDVRAADKELAKCLASLPDGSWPAVKRIIPAQGSVLMAPSRTAAHLARLCPRLQRASISTWYRRALGGDALCRALESLGAAHCTLEELSLALACSCLRPGSAQRAAAALARLRGLRKLDLIWIGDGAEEGASLLPAALSALSSLSSLEVLCPVASPLPSLAQCPPSLRDVTVRSKQGSWVLGILRSAPQLAGVTRLDIRLLV